MTGNEGRALGMLDDRVRQEADRTGVKPPPMTKSRLEALRAGAADG